MYIRSRNINHNSNKDDRRHVNHALCSRTRQRHRYVCFVVATSAASASVLQKQMTVAAAAAAATVNAATNSAGDCGSSCSCHCYGCRHCYCWFPATAQLTRPPLPRFPRLVLELFSFRSFQQCRIGLLRFSPSALDGGGTDLIYWDHAHFLSLPHVLTGSLAIKEMRDFVIETLSSRPNLKRKRAEIGERERRVQGRLFLVSSRSRARR